MVRIPQYERWMYDPEIMTEWFDRQKGTAELEEFADFVSNNSEVFQRFGLIQRWVEDAKRTGKQLRYDRLRRLLRLEGYDASDAIMPFVARWFMFWHPDLTWVDQNSNQDRLG